MNLSTCRICFILICFTIDKISQMSPEFKRIKKKLYISMKLQSLQGTGSYVRGRGCGDSGTGVRFIRNQLKPGCPQILPIFPTKPEGITKQCWLLKHCIQGGNLLQMLKQRRPLEFQTPEKGYKTGFGIGISVKPPQDCLFLLSKRL